MESELLRVSSGEFGSRENVGRVVVMAILSIRGLQALIIGVLLIIAQNNHQDDMEIA